MVDPGDEPTCQFERPANKRSKYNEHHIHYDLQAVQRLLDSMSELMHADHPRIGIITPYAPQARKIRATLSEWGWDGYVRGYYPRLPGTRVPGGRSRPRRGASSPDKRDSPTIPRFITDVLGYRGIATPATRLSNVAHSRARVKLIYVANVQNHREHSSEQYVLMKFVNDGVASGRIASHEL